MSDFFLGRAADDLLGFCDANRIQGFADQLIGHRGFKAKVRHTHFVDCLAVNIRAAQTTVIHVADNASHNVVGFAEGDVIVANEVVGQFRYCAEIAAGVVKHHIALNRHRADRQFCQHKVTFHFEHGSA